MSANKANNTGYGSQRKKWPWVVLVVVILLAGAGGGVWWWLGSSTSSSRDVSIVDTQPTIGTIVTTVNGAGNIANAFTELKLPTGITPAEVYVKAGDTIAVGQLLAKLDTSALDGAITALNTEFKQVSEKISQLYNGTTVEKKLTSPAVATVLELYAKPGDDIDTVMAEHGALMVLQLSDGSLLHITASSGTVASVYTAQGWKVYEGTEVIVLKVAATTDALSELETRRAELLSLLETFIAWQTKPYVYASEGGVVSSVQLAVGASLGGSAGSTAKALELLDSTKVTLNLTVDELDIASLAVGQKAEVTLDALEGQTFSGEVTKVATGGTVSGSLASYAVTLEVTRGEGMLAGMSATATIIKQQAEDVLVLPLGAIQEYGSQVYVYTTLDAEGNLGGETLITTGLSDGSYAEITSGISAGTTVYYRQQSTSSNQGVMFSSPGGGFSMSSGPQMREFSGGM